MYFKMKDNYEILQIIVLMSYENLYEDRTMTEFFCQSTFIMVRHSCVFCKKNVSFFFIYCVLFYFIFHVTLHGRQSGRFSQR